MRTAVIALVAFALVVSACNASSEDTDDAGVRLSFAPSTPRPTPVRSPEVSATPEVSAMVPRRTLGSQVDGTPQPTSPAEPEPTKVSCPVGEVGVTVTEVEAFDRGPGLWDVRVEGRVTNDTQGMVRHVEIDVDIRVPNADAESGSATVTGPFGPGNSMRWTKTIDVESSQEPEAEHVHVEVEDWSWGSADQDANCPRGFR